MSEQPVDDAETIANDTVPEGDGSIEDLPTEDDGPAISDPGHGLPGEAEPLPEWDADNPDGETTPDEDDGDLADEEPEDIDETVTDDEGTPSELDEDPDGE